MLPEKCWLSLIGFLVFGATEKGWLPENFWPHLLASLGFGLLGLVLILFGYKLFDWITPHIKVEQELAEKQNIAVAIVVGAVILGVSIVVGMAIG